MAATDINIDYADDGRTMQNATLAGNAAIELAPKQGPTGQKLSGNFMEIGLEPDGSVRSLSTRDNVTATLPATKDTAGANHSLDRADRRRQRAGPQQDDVHRGRRVPRSGDQDAGRAHRRARNRSTRSSTRPRARCKKPASPATSTSPMGRCAPSATRRATTSPPARSRSSGKDITPEIRDESLTLLAESIDVTLDPRKMTAKGNVRSTLLPPKKPAGNAQATKRPALLGDKEPVNILSDDADLR